ncbi:hypothetical protein [Streptomyces sp. NPDC059991]|uniref:hypothetical protein n=1 Tax=unclassified Streptomyces TaxID=2593676 RepID=UPI003685A16C
MTGPEQISALRDRLSQRTLGLLFVNAAMDTAGQLTPFHSAAVTSGCPGFLGRIGSSQP